MFVESQAAFTHGFFSPCGRRWISSPSANEHSIEKRRQVVRGQDILPQTRFVLKALRCPLRTKPLQDALRAAAGDHALGSTMISIVQPGKLPAAKRKALTQAFLDLL
jgi:hypothetical protein